MVLGGLVLMHLAGGGSVSGSVVQRPIAERRHGNDQGSIKCVRLDVSVRACMHACGLACEKNPSASVLNIVLQQ